MNAAQIKSALSRAIRESAAENRNGKQFSRERSGKLPQETLLRFLISAEGGSLAKELYRAGIDVTPAAVSMRRKDIPPAVLFDVFNRFNAACNDIERYRGLRLLAVDGSSINMARNPSAPSFVQNESAPNGYNQLHLNPLFDLCNKTYYDAILQVEPRKDEIGALIEMLKRNEFVERVLIIADRGYESYNLMTHLSEKPNVDFLIRVKQNHSAMREVARLPMCQIDMNISFTITTSQTKEDKRNRYIFLQVPKKSKPDSKTRRGRWDFPSPYPMHLRIVRFQLPTGDFETIATSLDSSFTIDDIKTLYAMRWGIETSFRDLKYTIGLVNLHGKSDAFAEQEIYAALTMFNFASRISREAVIRQPSEGVYAYKVNYKMATHLCREYLRSSDMDSYELMKQIAKNSVAIRPGRQDQRKLRAKGFVGFTYRVAA